MAKYGYIRVSTLQQDINIQMEYLHSKGVEDKNIYVDKKSGKNADREQLNKLKEALKQGDELYIHKLDRLARNTMDTLELVQYFNDTGIIVTIDNIGVIDDNPIGKVIIAVVAAIAEMERTQIIERTQEGRRWKRENIEGYKEGRKQKLNKVAVANLYRRYTDGETVTDLAKSYGLARQTIYNYIYQYESI